MAQLLLEYGSGLLENLAIAASHILYTLIHANHSGLVNDGWFSENWHACGPRIGSGMACFAGQACKTCHTRPDARLRELINLMGYAYDGTPEGLRALSQALPAVALSPLHP